MWEDWRSNEKCKDLGDHGPDTGREVKIRNAETQKLGDMYCSEALDGRWGIVGLMLSTSTSEDWMFSMTRGVGS